MFEIAGGLLGGDNTCDGGRKDSVVTEQFLSNFQVISYSDPRKGQELC